MVVLLAACAQQPPDAPLEALSGDVTWQLSFDETAHASGLSDCSYTRHYEGVEDRSTPWLCPSCSAQIPVSVTLSDEDQACFAQIDPDPYSTTEILGWGNGTWYRAPTSGYILLEQGTADVSESSVRTSNSLDWTDLGAPGEGQYSLQVDGELDRTTSDGDPLHGYRAPGKYACGWPTSVAGPYVGDYSLALGEPLPDGVFRDRCDDPVRLYDLAGTWLVVDVSAMDCGPCQDAADQEAAFVAAQEAAGVPTRVVTLLAPSLAAPNEEATLDDVNSWSSAFDDEESPVLADRALGLWLGVSKFGDGFAYPTFIVVDPQLQVVATQLGFGSWDEIAAKIHE